MVDSDQLNLAKAEYELGKEAFERGMYRESVQALEKANALLAPNTRFAGEVQIWLATAYEAAGQKEEAIALCQQASRHPDYETRKQGQRLLYILQAPQLTRRPEWLTQIPDLNELQEGESKLRAVGTPVKQRPAEPRFQVAEPIDPTQVNTKDNRFIWVALAATALLLGGLVWFS